VNIALIELNHMTKGVHTNTIPLELGAIATFLKNNVKEELEIRMFKNPHKFLEAMKSWKVDVLGMAQYAWTSELNLYAARLMKEKNPHSLIVAGGPSLDVTSGERFEYLKKRECIDVCVAYDGEIPFTGIVKRLLSSETKEDIRRSPGAGTYSIDPKSGKLVESGEAPPRLSTLDTLGAMYADGLFDELLDEGFHPFLQTQRGCPFKCTYCHTSDDYFSKVIFQSVENFTRDVEYLAKRYKGKHNVTMYMANANFGFFDQDYEITAAIKRMQEVYDWPKNISVNSGKNPEKILKLLSILKYKFVPSLSLQTLTPKVAKNIRRSNIPFEDFVAFQKEIARTIEPNTSTELILSLPEETKESFLKTISRVLNSGVQNIVVCTLMSLKGTAIAGQEYAERFRYMKRHRIVPRCFSEINGTKIFETEEVVVGTKEMSFEDYMSLRGLIFIITVFASSWELLPLRKVVVEQGISMAEWIFAVQGRISKFPGLFRIYEAFLRETEKELYPSREAIIEFFGDDKKYKMLCEGKFGDNLIRKYKAVMLSEHYGECLNLALSELEHFVRGKHESQNTSTLLGDLEAYLKTRNIGGIFRKGYKEIAPRSVLLNFDIPRWLTDDKENLHLENYKGKFPYSVAVTDYAKKRLRDFTKLNRDMGLSLQILYRDGHIKDFWPVWAPEKQTIRKRS